MKLEFSGVIVDVTCGAGGAGVTHLLDDDGALLFDNVYLDCVLCLLPTLGQREYHALV